MEKTLRLLQTGLKGAGQVLGDPTLDLNSPTAASGEFTKQMSLADKIPLVKPYLKKKHAPRKLDAKCLRALDPILTSLFSSENLGACDGVFVSRNQTGSRRNLCEAAVAKQICLKRNGVPDLMGDHGVELMEGEQKASSLQTGPKDSSFPLPASGPEQTSGMYPFAPIETDNSNHLHTGLFQDKSEEASLDLVFELLTQLQYHTHQGDGIPICVDFLQGGCAFGSDCPKHHTALPYHWQARRSSTQVWQSVAEDSQEQLERLYCNPDNEQIRLKYKDRVLPLDFNLMRVADVEYDLVRRLATPSSPNINCNCNTVWRYYCRDNIGWREYSEPVVHLIEDAACRGLKEVRFVTLQNQYILNIKEGFQQNAVFGFRRQIKKRPLFLSTVTLMPYLQTLGGIPTAISPAARLACNPPLSPGVSTSSSLYPETWVAMEAFQDFVQVPVSKEDKSYRTVYSLFHKTVSETKYKILKIMRVQNPFLWEKYKRKKEYMSRKMTEMDRMLNERHLFHGTSQDVVDGICKHNFDPRVCGKHATMFGQGSYFARKAIYSHNFSKRSSKGIHYMFLAKVLTGKYTVGNPTMRRPPHINAIDPSSDLFDSCVDNWIDPQIFVIFNDDQSYPYFIIEYEEVSDTVCI
ncbi:protein mono-ADP-ribosyltransferase TIPARP [Erpetoichthys calabaricus]|uniref:protein mono-ADP-ribosyltransferase TIPARP n=1 Tax=Erpetoichthys calabaricus TaxID=27687 RepID=UPI0022340FF2|nr:protein mono-ADP-ribosyltransferase TIPARP [Erpetoichthys calabaricus]